MSIEAKELRIGNLLHRVYDSPNNPNDLEEIVLASINNLTETYLCKDDNIGTLDELEPIPLTEEWLIKFGFIRHPWGLVKEELLFKDNLKCTELTLEVGNGFKTNVKHVHQLQNLYNALTQKELTIK